jgi:hypothetical protein
MVFNIDMRESPNNAVLGASGRKVKTRSLGQRGGTGLFTVGSRKLRFDVVCSSWLLSWTRMFVLCLLRRDVSGRLLFFFC